MRSGRNCFLTFLFIVLAATSVYAQTSEEPSPICGLPLRDVFDFRGVKLGMSPREVSAKLNVTWKLEDHGFAGFYFDREENLMFERDENIGAKQYYWESRTQPNPSATLAGIRFLTFEFSDDQLYMMSVAYDDKDSHYLTSGAKGIVGDLYPLPYIPMAAWTFKDPLHASIRCSDFIVSLMIENNSGKSWPPPRWKLYIDDVSVDKRVQDLVDQKVKDYYLQEKEMILSERERLKLKTSVSP